MIATIILTSLAAGTLFCGVLAVAIGISDNRPDMTIIGAILLGIHSSVSFIWKDKE